MPVNAIAPHQAIQHIIDFETRRYKVLIFCKKVKYFSAITDLCSIKHILDSILFDGDCKQ